MTAHEGQQKYMINSYFQSMSLARRLSLGFTSVLILLLAVAITSIYALQLQGERVQRIVQVNNVKTTLANELMESINDLAIRARSAALFTDMDSKQLQVEFDAAKVAEKTFLKTEEALSALMVGDNATDKERTLMGDISAAGKKVLPSTAESLEQALDADTVAAVLTLSNRVRPAEVILRAKVSELIDLQGKINEDANKDVLSLQRTVFVTLGILVTVALAMGGFIAWRITNSVVQPITQMQVMMSEIATSQDFSRRVPVERMDEIGMSIVAFNAMIGKIQESSQQLKQKTADIQAMMHYIPQGILTVVAGNKVHPEFSAYLETILETKDIAGRDLLELVFADSSFNAEILSQVEAAVSACIGEDSMNFQFNEHLLVSEVEKKMPDGRVKILDLSWSPITDDMDTVVRLMLCVRDVTELKALAAAAGKQKRELDIIGQILAISQEKFSGFVEGSVEFLAENKKIIDAVGATPKDGLDPETVTELFRNMHTIKGNARTYGFLHLTNMVHEAEQTYDDLRKNPDAVWDQEKLLRELASASDAIEEYAHINKVKLGRTGPGRRAGVEKYLMVQKQDIQDALDVMDDSIRGTDLASMRAAHQRVHNMLQMLGTVRVQEALEGILESLPSLAQELSKEPPHISIADHNIVLRTQIADLLKNVFMHLYRNSMDHGIETGSERVAKGKPAAGSIQLELALAEGKLQLKLRDDGRGLAVDYIRKKAIEKALITEDQKLSPEEIAQLIFAPGFSTAEQVTEVSGRGVGMDAVKSFVEREEGSIELRFLDPQANSVSDGYRPFETVISMPAKFAVQANT
jgi:two-component system chemotaxis sensor kinase CheA